MDIHNISIYSNHTAGKGGTGAFPGSSLLEIGKKGQVVQGQITKVGENISINFHGIEVSVARGAVRDAKEGDIRDFEIRDVTKDSIVLKEAGQAQGQGEVKGMVKTSVAPSGYSFAECLEASADSTQAKAEAGQNLAVLNGEDYASVEEEEGSLEKASKECAERAVARMKEKKEWKAMQMQEAAELRKELEEGLAKMQASGCLSQKTEGQIRNALQEAGIPATSANVARAVAALGMGRAALQVTDQTKAYLIENNLPPTIENLYQGKYSASVAVPSKDGMQDFADYQGQIEGILAKCGRADETGMENAKWLFAHGLPINAETLGQLEVLNQLPEKMTTERVFGQILFAMTAGASPEDAVLDDTEFVAAQDAIEGFQSIDDQTVRQAVVMATEGNGQDQAENGQNQEKYGQTGKEEQDRAVQNQDSPGQIGKTIHLAFLRQVQAQLKESAVSGENRPIPQIAADGMGEADILQITIKRQLAEIRQKMTVQSVMAMEKRGIHIETESLEQIIKSLREMENAYYSSQAGKETAVSDSELGILQESLEKTGDIANAHAALLGIGVRRQQLLTVNTLHAAARSQTANRQDWGSVFERVSTQVRPDLGDSIKKAFQGVPDILKDMGLEDTQANERAVRILGYNSMEVTEENIGQVKLFDAEVNRVIDNMKPTAVLELIRRGENPLDMPLDELNRELEEIREEKGISPEERYSRFLWQLEKSGQITEEERAGYIGVYRLLNQIQKADGAAVGAVLETGQEMTLGNLLKQARTRKGHGVDAAVDASFGMNEGAQPENSITGQIEAGFAKGNLQGQAGHQQQESTGQQEYYRHLAQGALSDITPSKLQEITDGGMEKLLGVSLEQFAEQMKQAAGSPEIARAYFEEQAGQIREVIQNGQKAQEYLDKLQIPATVENLIAASAVLEENYSPYQEASARRYILPKGRRQEFEETIDAVGDAIDNPEELQAQCEKAEKIMGEILTKSYEKADINIEDISKLRKLGQGIHFVGTLRQSQSYDIPIWTGDTVTALNLTVIHGAGESGKIQISMEDAEAGTISMDFKVAGSQVKGLILCDTRKGYEALREQGRALEENLGEAGYQIKNLSYGMDFKGRNELFSGKLQTQDADTAGLYRIAKLLVRSAAQAVRDI